VIPDLIYDVGMYDGTDTDYYLRCGYRVVGVEADPALCAQARRRFAAQIEAGRLTIVPRAVVAHAAPGASIAFWVNREHGEWSSVVETYAARQDHRCERIEVPAVTPAELLAAHGVPLYLKVDIEGADRACAEAIDPSDPPRFVSFEFSDDGLLDLLLAKGYMRFKCIRQNDLRALRPGMTSPPVYTSALARWLHQRPQRWRGKLLRLTRGSEATRPKHVGRLPDGTPWEFRGSTSGPFGEDAQGPWLSAAELRALWKPWSNARAAAQGESAWRHWFDLHATV
jgi:FkbM family methyltransferase